MQKDLTSKKVRTQEQLLAENEDLRARLEEAVDTLRAIRSGEVDALVVSGASGEQVFTLQGADHIYRLLVEDMNEGALTLSLDGVILYCNRRFAEMLKWPIEKVIGSNIDTFIASDSQRFLHEVLQQFDTRTNHRWEATLLAEDGTLVPGYISGKALQLEDSQELICLVLSDLTEQKRTEAIVASEKLAQQLMKASNQSRLELQNEIAERELSEEALKKSEEKIRLLFDEMLSGFALHEIICDPSGKPADYRFLSVNAAFERMTGLNASDILGKTILEVIPGTEFSWIERYGKVALTREPTQFENFATALGKYFEVRAYCPEHGKFATLIHDITDRKQAEEALQASDKMLKLAFAIGNIGAFQVDLASGKSTWTPEIRDLWGIPRTFAGDFAAYCWEHTHPDDLARTQQKFNDYAQTGKIAEMEFRIIRSDGTVRWIRWLGQVIQDPDLGTPLVIGVNMDISPQKQAEQDLKTLNSSLERLVETRTAGLKAALKELEAFSYSVSHDLRTPLRSLAGFVELLKEKQAGEQDAESRHYMDRISSSTRVMGRLIDDLLDFSRMGHGELMTLKVDLQQLAQEVIQEAAKMLPSDRCIDWRIGKLPVVTGDQVMLRQVLVNLISNALKYSGYVEAPVIELGALTEDPKEWTLFVRDNGVGFDMKYVDKLFKLFERLHSTKEFEGTGVGLATVRRIVQRHGGRTWAEGEVNKGATFFFTLEKESL